MGGREGRHIVEDKTASKSRLDDEARIKAWSRSEGALARSHGRDKINERLLSDRGRSSRVDPVFYTFEGASKDPHVRTVAEAREYKMNQYLGRYRVDS